MFQLCPLFQIVYFINFFIFCSSYINISSIPDTTLKFWYAQTIVLSPILWRDAIRHNQADVKRDYNYPRD